MHPTPTVRERTAHLGLPEGLLRLTRSERRGWCASPPRDSLRPPVSRAGVLPGRRSLGPRRRPRARPYDRPAPPAAPIWQAPIRQAPGQPDRKGRRRSPPAAGPCEIFAKPAVSAVPRTMSSSGSMLRRSSSRFMDRPNILFHKRMRKAPTFATRSRTPSSGRITRKPPVSATTWKNWIPPWKTRGLWIN